VSHPHTFRVLGCPTCYCLFSCLFFFFIIFHSAAETVVCGIAADDLQSCRGQRLSSFLRCFLDRGILREVSFWDVRKVA